MVNEELVDRVPDHVLLQIYLWPLKEFILKLDFAVALPRAPNQNGGLFRQPQELLSLEIKGVSKQPLDLVVAWRVVGDAELMGQVPPLGFV